MIIKWIGFFFRISRAKLSVCSQFTYFKLDYSLVSFFFFNIGEAINHKYTGQFRDKFSLIWDPYPQYIINSFGRRLHLILHQDSTFLPQKLKVCISNSAWQFIDDSLINNNNYERVINCLFSYQLSEVWYDDVLHTNENADEYEQSKGCFYKGTVRNEPYSVVTVSLCGGMVKLTFCNITLNMAFINPFDPIHTQFIHNS